MRNEEILRRTEEGVRESNKILIRELVRDFEERGVAPVWAIDGKVANLKSATKSKEADFARELKKSGLQKSDFCLLQEAKAKSKSLHILVVSKTLGKVRIYKETRWIDELHHDIKKKFFS
ncbi:MAG: hypothetical protein FJX34_01885 [Alphaproteobacteria bacterium]|nr:hypothetical protein [Alphaproteobacteria bacterium]